MKLTTLIALLIFASASMAQSVPNTFTAGTPALAAEVNENFSNLDGRVNTNATDVASVSTVVEGLFARIEFSTIFQSVESVAAPLCPVNTIPISASCHCEGDGSSRNFGYLFSCFNTFDGAAGGCYVEPDFFDTNLPNPIANVSVVCISATLVNGDPALTNPWSAAASMVIGGSSKPSKDITTEVAAADLQNAVTNQLSAIAAKSK